MSYDKNKARERMARGLCCSCNEPAEPGKRRCRKHAEEFNAYCRDRRAKLKAQFGTTQPGFDAKTYFKNRREAFLAAGMCPVCKKDPAIQGGSMCQGCLDKQRERQHVKAAVTVVETKAAREQQRQAWNASGLCVDCGGEHGDRFTKFRCRRCAVIYLVKLKGLTRHDARSRVGLCHRCDAVTVAGQVLCESCQIKKREKRDYNRRNKLCIGCSQPVTSGAYCLECLKRNSARYAARVAAGVCPDCGSASEPGRPAGSLCRKHRFRSRLKDRKKVVLLKAQIIAAYGGKCQCPGCNECRPEFLHLDHIHNDGNAERRKLYGKQTGASSRFYGKVRRDGFPKDTLQLLCVNCNTAKHAFGRCPHISQLQAPLYPQSPNPETLESYTAELVAYLSKVYAEKMEYRKAAAPSSLAP